MEFTVSWTEKVKSGQVIIPEGSWAFYAYVLQAGKAQVFKNIHGKQVQIGTLNKGDVFGEMAFLGGAGRTASVVADGDVEVGMIARDAFLEAMAELPEKVRSKLNAIVSDLTCISEISGHLIARLRDVQKIDSKMIDMKTLEKESDKMPDLLRQIVFAMAQRLNASIEGWTKLSTQVEEAVKAVDCISSKLAK